MADKTLINNYTLEGSVICQDPVFIMSSPSTGEGGFSILTSLNFRRKAVTSATYTVNDYDVVVGVNYAGTVTVTLPPAAVTLNADVENITNGKHFIILDESGLANGSTTKITIAADGSDTILDSTTFDITTGYMSVTLFSNGVDKWFII